ncbi:MAG: transcriptional repressor LexA [Planctomycetota bacterium]|nr:transcriptional repressor LexA [Planctomycetota bacterium]
MGTSAKLTERQQVIYDFIRGLIVRRGYGPTVREIAQRMDISSPNGVMGHLKALERKGFIRRDSRRARAIELAEGMAASRKACATENEGLLFAGFVPAGFTNHAFELSERINLGEMFNNDSFFVLQVKGDTMIEAHIKDGDYVVCKSSSTAEKGQMVVALNEDNEATLKYWYPEKKRIRLQPANAKMKPIYVTNALVRGVVVGVVRSKL